MRLGIVNYNYHWGKITYIHQEDVIPGTAPESFIKPNFDFGIYYNTRTFYFGMAVDHLNTAQFNLLSNQDTIFSRARAYKNVKTTLGKAFVLNENLVLKTSILFRHTRASNNLDINAGLYLQTAFKFVTLKDIYTGISKSFVFAIIIAIVGAYQGFKTVGGAVGVGKATTVSVVTSFVLIIIADSFMTAIYFFSDI